MDDPAVAAGMQQTGEYVPAGEGESSGETFTAPAIAAAFGVAEARVRRAIGGEFGQEADAQLDSRQVQYLAEVLLADRPQTEREAALMHLGAYTPRSDHEWGIGEAPPGEESDRVAGDDDHVSQH